MGTPGDVRRLRADLEEFGKSIFLGGGRGSRWLTLSDTDTAQGGRGPAVGPGAVHGGTPGGWLDPRHLRGAAPGARGHPQSGEPLLWVVLLPFSRHPVI